MSSYQLLTESELLKLSISELQHHYRLLMCNYKDLESRKIIFVDKAMKLKDTVNKFNVARQQREERDRENGSLAHEISNQQVSEAIDLWKVFAMDGEILNAYDLGKLHNEETRIEKRIRTSMVDRHELIHPESADWPLSYSVYTRIYTAINKAKKNPGIESDDFHDAVLRLKR